MSKENEALNLIKSNKESRLKNTLGEHQNTLNRT